MRRTNYEHIGNVVSYWGQLMEQGEIGDIFGKLVVERVILYNKVSWFKNVPKEN